MGLAPPLTNVIINTLEENQGGVYNLCSNFLCLSKKFLYSPSKQRNLEQDRIRWRHLQKE